MAKKCKYCNTRIASEDKHSACVDCRADKKGEDPCVKGKQCRYCETLLKITSDPKKDKAVSSEVGNLEVDDSILDEEDPPTAKSSLSRSSSLEDMIASMSAQLNSLHRRMDSFDGSKSSADSTVTREATLTQATATENKSNEDGHPKTGESDGEIVEDDADSLADKEPDPNFVENYVRP